MILPVIIPADLPDVDVRSYTRADGSVALLVGRKGSFGPETQNGFVSPLEDSGNPAGRLITFKVN